MVYENCYEYPTKEGSELNNPPPSSTSGFQKLSSEYFAKGDWEKYALPYITIGPFNCIGIGEKRALGDKDISSANVKLAMSHVVPDIVQKILKGQDPLHILGNGDQVRHYTYGGDLAEGIRVCMEHKDAINNDFNIWTSISTSVLQLSEIIWKKINPDKTFKYVCNEPYEYDVKKRVPDISKA